MATESHLIREASSGRVIFFSGSMTRDGVELSRASDNRDFAFFVFERTKHQPRRNLRSYLVLQRLFNEAARSPGIDAFWY